MRERLKSLSVKGLMWAMTESVGVAGLSLGVFALMARLLLPQDFGLAAIAGAFIFSFNLIVGHSFSDALVQRDTLDADHLDTAFWTTLGISLFLMVACYLGAGFLVTWFHEPKLTSILPVLSLVLPLSAIGTIQTALFRRELRFRAVALRSLAGRLTGAAVGIAMAFGGYGVWSLVGQQIAGVLTTAVAMAIASSWRPRFRFSLARLRELWSFGFHVSASQLIGGVGEQAMNLLVGALFGSVLLGYFSIAWRMAQLIRSLIASAVYQVSLSAFARLQQDPPAVARAFLQATRLSCLFGFPIGVGMAVLADPTITVMFGRKWEASAPLLAILAFQMFPAFYAMFFSAVYRALGKASWVSGLSLFYVTSGISAIVLISPWGVNAISIAWICVWVALMPVQIVLLKRLLNVSSRALIAPIFTPSVASVVMGLVLLQFGWTLGKDLSPLSTLLITVPLGALVYAATIFLISPDLFRTAANTARVVVTPTRSAA